MPPNGADREWERWRGASDTRAQQHEEELRKLWDWKESSDRETALWREHVSSKFAVVETKIATFAALGAVAGGLLATFIQKLLM